MIIYLLRGRFGCEVKIKLYQPLRYWSDVLLNNDKTMYMVVTQCCYMIHYIAGYDITVGNSVSWATSSRMYV
jgi:hypothetical protein